MASLPRLLIVNADDFGLSSGVNRGISSSHEQGIVTSASLMVRMPAAREAADYARAHPKMCVGLHVDLGEWTYRDGEWVELYRHAPLDDAAAVEAEVARQLVAFRKLVGRDPTHLDSHQHVHRRDPAHRILAALGASLRVPVRHFTPGITYCGGFYGQDDQGRSYRELITADALIALLEKLPPGVTELACHPGEGDLQGSMYVCERRDETTALCDARVRAALQRLGIELVTFYDSSARWHQLRVETLANLGH